MTNDQWIATLLAELITFARAEFDEPDYTYRKVRHMWQPGRGRRAGQHVTLIQKAPECTKDEYEANVEQGKRDQREAFMGRLHKDYYTYRRELKTEGWPQRLVAMIEAEAER